MRFLVCALFAVALVDAKKPKPPKPPKIDRDCVMAIQNLAMSFSADCQMTMDTCPPSCQALIDAVGMNCDSDSFIGKDEKFSGTMQWSTFIGMSGGATKCMRTGDLVVDSCGDALDMFQQELVGAGCNHPGEMCGESCQAGLDRIGDLCKVGKKYWSIYNKEEQIHFTGAEMFQMWMNMLHTSNPAKMCMASGSLAECGGWMTPERCAPNYGMFDCFMRNATTCMDNPQCHWIGASAMEGMCEVDMTKDVMLVSISCGVVQPENCHVMPWCMSIPSMCTSDQQCGNYPDEQCPALDGDDGGKGNNGKGEGKGNSGKGKGKGEPQLQCDVSRDCRLSQEFGGMCLMLTEAECGASEGNCRWSSGLKSCLPTLENAFWCPASAGMTGQCDSAHCSWHTECVTASDEPPMCEDIQNKNACLKQDGCYWSTQQGGLMQSIEGSTFGAFGMEFKPACSSCRGEEGNVFKWFQENVAEKDFCYLTAREEHVAGLDLNMTVEAYINIPKMWAAKGKKCSKGMAAPPMESLMVKECGVTPPSPANNANSLTSNSEHDDIDFHGGSLSAAFRAVRAAAEAAAAATDQGN